MVSLLLDLRNLIGDLDGESPCQNGGDCLLIDNGTDFKCNCSSVNYSGKHCELFNDRPFDVSISDDPTVGQNIPNDQASQKVKVSG